MFPLRTCHYKLPEKKGPRECLQFYLGQCSGPCHGHISREDYGRMVREMLQFLEGRTEPVASRLQQEMAQASADLNFEKAAVLRDQLAAVEKVSQRQKMHALGGDDADILAVAVDGRDGCVVVLKVRGGKLIGSEHRLLQNRLEEPPETVLNAFLGHTYIGEREYPGTIYLSHPVEDSGLYEEVISSRAGRKVKLHVPERGDKARLVKMAERNSHLLLEEVVMRREQARQRVPEALLELQKTLSLPRLPRLVVCFDVSTIQGAHAVAAMSCFRNGNPKKSAYRKFRIRHLAGQDDFAMIKEAVGRYFRRVGESEAESPNLVVIDGGKGQLSAACEAITDSGAEMPPVVALAKREEELYLPAHPKPYRLSRRSQALRLLQRIRDEAHRFAVGYHRVLRSKNTFASRLSTVPGIGPARLKALIERFGSPAAVARAEVEEIASLKGFSAELAVRVKEHIGSNQLDAQGLQDSG